MMWEKKDDTRNTDLRLFFFGLIKYVRSDGLEVTRLEQGSISVILFRVVSSLGCTLACELFPLTSLDSARAETPILPAAALILGH